MFLALWLLSLAAFWAPVRQLLDLAWSNTEYNHLLVAPCVSLCLIVWSRRDIFRGAAFSPGAGIPVFLIAAAAGLLVSRHILSGSSDAQLSVSILLLLVAWAAAFWSSYGRGACGRARFPLLFLLLTIPVPAAWVDRGVVGLQTGSTNLVSGIFQLTGVPFFRHGFTFELPRISIEVAKECSSIHSFWALLITSLILGHFLLRSLGTKVCLTLLTVPIAMFTNSLRISGIWYLATHVDPEFMYGNLHRNGGVLFSLISLSILLCSLWVFRKFENPRRARSSPPLKPQAGSAPDAGDLRA
jgi:exosortase